MWGSGMRMLDDVVAYRLSEYKTILWIKLFWTVIIYITAE